MAGKNRRSQIGIDIRRRSTDVRLILVGLAFLCALLVAIGQRDGARHVAPHMWKSALSIVRLMGSSGDAGVAP